MTRPAAGTPAIETMISVKTLAKRLDVSDQHIYNQMDGGHLPYFRSGRRRLIAESDALAYIAKSRVGPPRLETVG